MTTVSILTEMPSARKIQYRAIAGTHQSTGNTAGEALDALNAQLGPTDSGSLIIVQQWQTDPYFSEAQYARMKYLLDLRDSLTDDQRAELETLVKQELIASAKRTEALANALGR